MAFRFDPKLAVSHPRGVKPWGNLFLVDDLAGAMHARVSSLGLFSRISEEIMLDHIFSLLNEADLGTLSAASQYVCAYAEHEDLWRELWKARVEVTGVLGGFAETWKASVRRMIGSKRQRIGGMDGPISNASNQDENCSKALSGPSWHFPNVFSDALYAPYRASGMAPTQSWLQHENIDRVDYKKISPAEFVAKYESTNSPLILTHYVEEQWGSLASELIDLHELSDEFACGSVSMSLRQFADYQASGLARIDESPFFVFDTKTFASHTHKYSVPPHFASDLFDKLAPPFRPDNAWLLIGPANASSKWHVDPNATNAWNAVISGSKRWLMLPPHLGPPPGVTVSGDGFAVRQPLHLGDWLEEFYPHTKGLVECTCRAGEIVFVPRGWWHCVRNIEPTVAVTQNYAAASSVGYVRSFLKNFSHCVSGIEAACRPLLAAEFDRVLGVESQAGDDQAGAETACENACGENACNEPVSFWGNLGSRSLQFSRVV